MKKKSSSKVVLITGASSGIGKAIAELLHENGHIVYATSRNIEKTISNVGYRIINMDVTNPTQISNVIQSITSSESKIDVLINSAGYSLFGPIENASIDEIKDQFGTNFFGAITVSKSVIATMKSRRDGMIINIGSIGGIVPLPYQAAYSASKSALSTFTEVLRMELSKYKIEVTILEPGDFKTPITQNRKFTSNVNNKEQIASTLQVVQTEEKNGADVSMITKKVNSLISKRNISPRYFIGNAFQIFAAHLMSFMPIRMLEKLIKLYYKVEAEK